ncbi:MAG: outer membrane lipoprotein carrier protein LolA [Bacteroidia bacterium]|nr:outer membrane lipoprotein carrier protein LolA [Bacteroidia bacterium]MDW8089216.1 outer membrane lipoprotein carrier protein LolA [Bacteroidia bacterium]
MWRLALFLLWAQVDPRADQLIQRSHKKLKSLSYITVDFAYTLEDRADTTHRKIHYQGTFRYKPRHNKFAVDIGDRAIFCDGTTIWQFLRKEREVNVSAYNPKESFSLERVFRLYERDMKVRWDKTEAQAGRTLHKVSLFPISEVDYFRVEVWIEAQSELPYRVRFWYRDGQVETYELRRYGTQAIPDTAFVFNPAAYPGVQIIDLR